ncbi:MAG: hypothetical protein EHM79_12640 [Geobacter sp.]|nr:MAG: hypothetical protein EHM79_12640 [Geobacter sp.]
MKQLAAVRQSRGIARNQPPARKKVPNMDRDKQKQEISLIGRLFSLEALLIIMGFLSLVSGIITRDLLRLSLGIIILGGTLLAIIFRRKRKLQNTSDDQTTEK